MKIESEKDVEAYLRDELKRIGGMAIKLNPINFNGLPDRLCLLPGGRLFFIELKTTKKKPGKLQAIIHKKLRDLGFEVLVIDQKEQIKQFILIHE